MVKIINQFGDVKKGKQHTVVYQNIYGNQMRRMLQDKKDEHTRGQLEQRARFKTGINFAKGLTKAQRDFIKSYMTEKNIRSPDGLPTTWYSFVKKIAMTRPKVEIETEGSGEFEAPYQNWNYRKPITLNNTSGGECTNHQVLITLTTSNFNYSHCKNDGSDIRFSQDDKTTPLNYWLEDWNYNGTSKLWVKVDNIPTGENICCYLYYDNSGATSESNGDNTFLTYNVTGIKGFWCMDENSWNGTPDEVKDETGINHGVASGATTIPNGKYNRCGNFGGVSDYVGCGDDPSLDILNSISFECWIYVDTFTLAQIAGRDDGTNRNYFLDIDNTGKATLVIFTSNGAHQSITETFSTGEWHHLVGVYNGSYITMYIDGAQSGTPEAHTGTIDNDDVSFSIGSREGVDRAFDGRIDELRIYNREITQTEITAFANNYMQRMGSYYNVRKWSDTDPTINLGEEESTDTDNTLAKITIHHPAIKSYKIMNGEDIVTSIEGLSNLETHISTVVTRANLNLTASKIIVKTLADQEYEFIVK